MIDKIRDEEKYTVYYCLSCEDYFRVHKNKPIKCPYCGERFKKVKEDKEVKVKEKKMRKCKPRYSGYIMLQVDNQLVPEHRLIVQALGIDLTGKCIHHIDGNKKNNLIDNLYICTWDEHKRLHAKNPPILVKSNVLM